MACLSLLTAAVVVPSREIAPLMGEQRIFRKLPPPCFGCWLLIPHCLQISLAWQAGQELLGGCGPFSLSPPSQSNKDMTRERRGDETFSLFPHQHQTKTGGGFLVVLSSSSSSSVVNLLLQRLPWPGWLYGAAITPCYLSSSCLSVPDMFHQKESLS